MIQFDKKELRKEASGYFQCEKAVRFQDVDAAGYVFFARFFDYVHEAYEAFLRECGTPLHEVLKEGSWGAPLRHVEADYLSPARYGDSLVVQLVAAEVEPTELSLGWRLAQETADGSQVVAVVQTVHTFIDPASRERISVPSQIADALSQNTG